MNIYVVQDEWGGSVHHVAAESYEEAERIYCETYDQEYGEAYLAAEGVDVSGETS